ncbi:hypothetical protein [Bradyrhizobium sp. Tv2a-2]|nr:hypothetical protein [Bradyrhizobium sp. Tv2a-2]
MSPILWVIFLIVGLKYAILILRADNTRRMRLGPNSISFF